MLSIITINLNDKIGLEKTVSSVLNQRKNCFFEYIVIDGDSTDGSKQVITQYKSNIDIIIVEKDSGIYDAMNKGAKVATGDALLFLNSGDCFIGDVLASYISPPAFLNVKYVNFEKKLVSVKIRNCKTALPNCHQGIIFENKHILFDTHYRICADYKFFLDHGYDRVSINKVPSSGYVFYDSTGVSSRNITKRDHELFRIRRGKYGLLIALIFEILPFIKRVVRSLIIVGSR